MIINIQGIIITTDLYYATLFPSPQTLILNMATSPITTLFPLSSLQLLKFLLSTLSPNFLLMDTVPDTLQLDSAIQPKLCTKVVL